MGLAGGWSDVIVEGNGLSIIKKSQTMLTDRSQIGVLIQNIQQLKMSFERVLFHYIPRSANALAHILAKTTFKEGIENYLVALIPDFAVHQYVGDSVHEPN